jgi:PII-like signaling protein
MKTVEVTMVRVYLSETNAHLKTLIKRLNDWGKVKGVTVFRGIAGFGQSGRIHSSVLMAIADDDNLPVILEFFDEPAKAAAMIDWINNIVGPGHVVSWAANLSME